MKEKTLVKLAIICSILGIIALLVISESVKIEENNTLTAEDGDAIKVKGIVKSIRGNEKYTSIEIETVQTVTATAFDAVDLQKGQEITVIGEIEDKEIIIEEIT